MNKNSQVFHRTLKNGLQICAVSFPDVKTVSLHCYVFTGSIYETHQNSGISHFVEHMLFRGNKKLGDSRTLNLKMEELGGEINAATSFDLTEFWLDFHIDHLEQGVTRFCDFLQYPLFEQIEVERSIILEEILGDYNENNELVDLDSLVSREIWPGHAMGLPVIGNTQTVGAVMRSDLRAWHDRYYTPGNMIIGVSGDVDIDRIVPLIEAAFEQAPVSSRNHYSPIVAGLPLGNQLRLVQEKDNQFGLLWAFPIYPLTADLRVEYQLIRRLLDDGYSSRLQYLVREEKGLVYDISADMQYFESGAVLGIQCLVGVERIEELIDTLTLLINDLICRGVTQQELDLVKHRYKTSRDCHSDTAQGTMFNALGPMVYSSARKMEEDFAQVDQIELGQINKTLKKLLKQNRTCFALVGPFSEHHESFVRMKLQPWISGKNKSK